MKETVWERCKRAVKSIWPKMDPELEGAKQKTPFGINRFVLLVIIIIYTATSACIYFDWSAIRNLLLRADKYKYLNTESVIGQEDITTTPQYAKINTLFPITLAVHFSMSVMCGFLYDHMGPKLTAILGQTFNIICWIFLSIDTTLFDTTLVGFIFLGLGADTAFIPILTIANLFPDAATFILTVVGAAASLSFAVPATLNLIYKVYPTIKFSSICYGYIGIILLPCLLTAILCFPMKPFKGLDYYMAEEEKRRIEEVAGKDVIQEVEGEKENINLKDIEARKEDDDNTLDKKISTEKSEKDSQTGKQFHLDSIKLFFRSLLLYPSICVISYFILFNISTVFYGMVNESYFQYDKSIIDIINVLLPLSCIPCIIFGRLVNRFGAAAIILVMNACSALMHATALIQIKVLGLFSAFFYMCVTSMYTSQIYCFIQNAYPTIIFGKLIGFASLCGGISSLVCEILYNHVVSEAKKNTVVDPSKVAYVIISLFVLMFIPLVILYMNNYERFIENVKADETEIEDMKETEDQTQRLINSQSGVAVP